MSDYNRLIGANWPQNLNNRHVLLNPKSGVILLAETLLLLLLVIGDYFIFDSTRLIILISKISGLSERLTRALMDNTSHSLVGLISWFIVTFPKISVTELLFAGIFSSIIDIDHFISAKSFYLNDAISLPTRPFLHNSLTLIFVNCAIFGIAVLFIPEWLDWTVIFFISWFSHHVRDANRRGLWLGGLYNTEPIKDHWYLAIIILLPLFIRFLRLSNFEFQSLIAYRDNAQILSDKIESHII